MTDYWAWRYVEDPKLADEIEDEGFDAEDIEAQWAAEAEGQAEPTVDHAQMDDPDDWETL